MNKQYEKPAVCFVSFESKDDIAYSTSGGIGEGDLPTGQSASFQDQAAFQLP